jgi:cytochrome oxidase Cu insertion factor (SCO1/SenC/PrrC family)
MLVFMCATSVNAQSKIKTDKIAPFAVKLADGKIFTSAQLKKGAVMLVYFSPDCDHCRHFTKEMLDNYKTLFADKQVVMVTYLSVDEVKKFETEFETKNFPNVIIGTEERTFVVRNYYNVTRFPFVALYNKLGKEVKIFANSPSFTDVTKFVKTL